MQNEIESREKGKESLFSALETGCNMVMKLKKLNKELKPIMLKLIREALQDYSSMDEYAKQQISDMEPL